MAVIAALLFSAQLMGQDRLVWNDEFNYTGAPDTTRWMRAQMHAGQVNNELQRYVTDAANSYADGEFLHIRAINAAEGITSARLTSRGKGEWLHGRIEARIKVPGGRGTWPAFWMMPANPAYGGWPRSGEIDIMEYVGYAADTIHGTIHTMAYNHVQGTQKGKKLYVEGAQDDFHIYTCLWDEQRIEIFADGVKYFEFANDRAANPCTWPFDRPFYVILNLAIGGDWGGKRGVDPAILPCEMLVDWVRVYQ